MKFKNYLLILVTIVTFISFQSFKNSLFISDYHTSKPLRSGGAAFNGLGGSTGAPSEGLCFDCHSGGSFTPSINLVVRNSANNIVTTYNPGETYNLTFTVSASGAKFGMQATSLNSSNNSSGTFSSQSSNARIVTSGSRTYLEQNATSNSGTFTSQWTAPAAGTGTVRFYFVGLAVNGTGSTNGDNSTTGQSLQLTEAPLNSIDFEFTKTVQIKQNPIKDVLSIQTNKNYKNLTLEIFDITGKKVYNNSYSNTNTISINFNSEAGIYFLKLNNEDNASARIKFIKE